MAVFDRPGINTRITETFVTGTPTRSAAHVLLLRDILDSLPTLNPAGQGPQGDPGPRGPAGRDGAQGPAGQNGAQGPAGRDGSQGPQGDRGPQGDPGPAGTAGAAGMRGNRITWEASTPTPSNEPAGAVDGDLVVAPVTNGVGLYERVSGAWVLRRSITSGTGGGTQLPSPVISAFSIAGQANMVDPATTISGTQTFNYTVQNSGNVAGNLTLRQSGRTNPLSTSIAPGGTTVSLAVQSVTLAAGQSVTFTLEGTANMNAGGQPFSRTFTVTARQATDYVYLFWDQDGDVSGYTEDTADRTAYANPQDLTIPSATGNQHLVYAQRATDPDPRQMNLDGLNQIGGFTKTANAFMLHGVSFDAWISNHQLTASAIDGDTLGIVR